MSKRNSEFEDVHLLSSTKGRKFWYYSPRSHARPIVRLSRCSSLHSFRTRRRNLLVNSFFSKLYQIKFCSRPNFVEISDCTNFVPGQTYCNIVAFDTDGRGSDPFFLTPQTQTCFTVPNSPSGIANALNPTSHGFTTTWNVNNQPSIGDFYYYVQPSNTPPPTQQIISGMSKNKEN